MRNFGIVPRLIGAATPQAEVKTLGIGILVTSGVVLIGLPIAICALAIRFG